MSKGVLNGNYNSIFPSVKRQKILWLMPLPEWPSPILGSPVNKPFPTSEFKFDFKLTILVKLSIKVFSLSAFLAARNRCHQSLRREMVKYKTRSIWSSIYMWKKNKWRLFHIRMMWFFEIPVKVCYFFSHKIRCFEFRSMSFQALFISQMGLNDDSWYLCNY